MVDALPHVDEHATAVAAEPGAVWDALLATLERASSPAAAPYARLVGCTHVAASGPRPLDVGSTLVGFAVTAADPGRELVLRGRHRFSDYALLFRLDPLGAERTRLRAETRAAFPGLAGGLYRQAVIGSGGHAVLLRRLLREVRERAER